MQKKTCQKVCESLRKQAKNIIDFEKKKNVTVSKKRTKFTSRCNSMLYLPKQIHKKSFHNIKTLEKLGTYYTV